MPQPRGCGRHRNFSRGRAPAPPRSRPAGPTPVGEGDRSLSRRVRGCQQVAHVLVLRGRANERLPSLAANAAAYVAATGARGPSTIAASWASRSATLRSPKRAAVCNAMTSWAGWPSRRACVAASTAIAAALLVLPSAAVTQARASSTSGSRYAKAGWLFRLQLIARPACRNRIAGDREGFRQVE